MIPPVSYTHLDVYKRQTSDEALIILISEPSRGKDILLLLLFKIIIGITAGYIVDLFVKKHPEKEKHLSLIHI